MNCCSCVVHATSSQRQKFKSKVCEIFIFVRVSVFCIQTRLFLIVSRLLIRLLLVCSDVWNVATETRAVSISETFRSTSSNCTYTV